MNEFFALQQNSRQPLDIQIALGHHRQSENHCRAGRGPDQLAARLAFDWRTGIGAGRVTADHQRA
jgi:hypothetical protein